MSNSLMNVQVVVAGLAAGAQVIMPHTLHDGNGHTLIPNFIYPFAPGTLVRPIAFTALSVTYQNFGTTALAANVSFRVAYDHTIPRGVTTAAAQFIYAGPAAGSTPVPAPADAMFFGNTTGTGSAGNDYAATVAVGAAVPFPRLGPAAGAVYTPVGTTQFTIPATGIYEVSWQVGFSEASQLQLWGGAGGVTIIANTTATSGAGTQQNSNQVLISATLGDLISLRNPPGNAAALTVTPADGSLTHAQSPNITFRRVS